MSNSIKQLKPSRSTQYSQGYINQNSCKKLFESLRGEKIIYRSTYEKQFIYWLENNDYVLHWGSECVPIEYYNIIDNKKHTYYPDFLVETKDGTMLIEIKPHNQTTRPTNKNSYMWKEWIKNMCKWKAAREFCSQRNIQFRILTEKTINKL